MKAQDFNGRGIVCVFYDWEERCWLRGESYYNKEETQFMYADDWEKYEAQRLLLEESMSFVTLDDDTAKLILEGESVCDITGLPMPRSLEEKRELSRDIDKAFVSLHGKSQMIRDWADRHTIKYSYDEEGDDDE